MSAVRSLLPELTLEVRNALRAELLQECILLETYSYLRNTITSCCLVSQFWDKVFRPLLYGKIFVESGGRRTLSLTRTLRHTQPAFCRFVRHLELDCATTPNAFTALLTKLPTLRVLVVYALNTKCTHPRYLQSLGLLPESCQLYVHLAVNIQNPMVQVARLLRSCRPRSITISSKQLSQFPMSTLLVYR